MQDVLQSAAFSPEHDWDCGSGAGPQRIGHPVFGHLGAQAMKTRVVIGGRHAAPWAKRRSRKRRHLRRHQLRGGKKCDLGKYEVRGPKVNRQGRGDLEGELN